ncbi:hypothetical protein [Pantoea sp. BAV 3049]|uniref:hypothetical protein n=1 Tax=Pantoea sp. BAV 3049 TaxID=2654188 RepID=UPI00131C2BD2|nr:hypothetical protein [Pantoea sp. BAV 3049]
MAGFFVPAIRPFVQYARQTPDARRQTLRDISSRKVCSSGRKSYLIRQLPARSGLPAAKNFKVIAITLFAPHC